MVPKKLAVKDIKVADSLTLVEFNEIEFDIEVNKNIFSLKSLKR